MMNLRDRLNHIVVATNLSEGARPAYGHAAAVAKLFGAKITLLYVDEVADGAGGTSIPLGDYLATLNEQREGRVREARADIERHGVKVNVEVVAGFPKTQINKWVRAHGGDLVVMTKRNRGEFKERLLGSTTQRVLRIVSSPILVVHEQDESGADGKLPVYKHILAATDLSDMADRGIRATLSIADISHSAVTFVHVLRMPRLVPLGASAAAAAALPEQKLKVLRTSAEAKISRKLRALGDERARPLILLDNNAGEAICNAADTEGADLITLPTSGRTGLRQILLGSTAERVARIATKPVLVFPRPFLEHFRSIETGDTGGTE